MKQAWLCVAVRNGFIIIWIHFGQHFYIINVIYACVIYTHAIDLTGGKCYFTYINLAGVLSEIIVREFLPCIPVLCGYMFLKCQAVVLWICDSGYVIRVYSCNGGKAFV